MLQTTFSLRSKIILLVSGTAFCTAFIIGGLNYYGISEIATDKAIEKLAGETRLAALQVRSAYAEMRKDAFTISGAPAVLSFIYSKRNGGIDPRDGASEASLRNRLNTVFTQRIKARRYYRQIRFIGLADNGRELVRVTGTADGIIDAFATENMQEKGNEAWFQEGKKLLRDQCFYSSVTYRREAGNVDANLTPTIRIVIPVFDDQNNRFGMIVINADYEAFLNETLRDLNLNAVIYVTDHQGNYIQLGQDGKISRLEVAENYSSPPPAFIREAFTAKAPERHFAVDDSIGYQHRLIIDPPYSEALINTLILVPKSELFASTNALLDRSLMSGAFLILAASLAAALLGTRFTRSFARMTGQINAFGHGGQTGTPDLPVHLRDEVGEMARAFHGMLARLDLSDTHREQLAAQLDAFIANAVDGFIIINDRGVIEKVNPALLNLFGYESRELVGENVAMLMPEAVQAQQGGFLHADPETGTRTYVGTIRDEIARRKNGSTFPIALSISELRIANRSIFSAIIRDMTAVRIAQREIERHAAELERSNQELDQFAYVASHDLKAPLRVINNAARWLEEDLGDKLTDDDRENMTLLRNRVQRMEKLLDDLLDYSRLGKARDSRYTDIIDGGTMIDDLLPLIAPPSGMKIRFADAFKSILVYRMPLQQVLFNLISNAIKHHDRGDGLIEVGVAPIEDGFRFSVRDDGPGIPKEFHEQIFEMFLTLKPRDQVEGSGMGLALVKKSVERYGGVITVTSDGERGTEFVFTWPAKRQSSNFSEKAA
jgi:PAS domain S-box-containing protein